MTHSILITKYIRDILSQDEELMKLLPKSRIIAVDAKLGTKFPFVVLVRTGIVHKFTKDGSHEDDVAIRIYVVDDNYVGSVTIADEITNWLEGHRFSDENISIARMTLTSATEEYDDRGAFIQILDFNINTQNK